MKVAYLDCFSGISGDMALGAFLDAGLSETSLVSELKKLGLANWKLTSRKVEKQHISATKVDITYSDQKKHRHYTEIIKIIDDSGLPETVKKNAKSIFTKLGEAEALAHNIPIEEVHFHEVGAIDSIIDIVGFAIALELLGIEKVYASQLPLSHGTIKCDHGEMPIPTPATLNCINGFKVYYKEVNGELITPTGAAIIGALAVQKFPDIKLEKTGTGAGTKDFPHPNILRILIGEAEKAD